MSVFIKECNSTNVEEILPLLKKDVEVYNFDQDSVLLDDIVICSKNDLDFLEANRWKYKCVIYEDTYKRILENLSSEYYYNYDYDYYHLKYELEKAKTKDIDTLFSGSSYGVFGIDLDSIDRAVNLSMISQDLYYSLRGIYDVCAVNEGIKNIVLCTPYYYFFSDLSRTQNQEEISRVAKVYDPLFRDVHSCVLLNPKLDILFKSEIFDIPLLMETVVQQECAKGYFSNNRKRKDCETRCWSDKKRSWSDLDEEEKAEAGRVRASYHMEGCKYINSFYENKIYFEDFVDFTAERGINLLLVVPPHSRYYAENITKDCKAAFFDVINGKDCHLLDLSEDPRFDEEDYNDADHLNDTGATKMTRIIMDRISNFAK